MKPIQKILILAIIALACFYGWNLKNLNHKKVDENAELAKECVSAIAAIAHEKAAAETKTPPPLAIERPSPFGQKKLPSGEYVVIERHSVMTDAGIKVFDAGDRVTKVEGGYTDGKITMPVPSSKLSDSAALALQLAFKARIERDNRVAENTPEKEITPEIKTPPPLALPPAPDPRIALLDRQISMLQDRVKSLSEKTTSAINANGPTITRLNMQISDLMRQKAALTR